MSGDQDPEFFDFSFPQIGAPGRAPAGDQTAANPFGVNKSPPAAAKQPQQQPQVQLQPQQQPQVQLQPQQQPQVQLQRPVQPPSSEPLTARSTVVHASSKAAAPQLHQQQGGVQVQAAAPPKPVPITQVQAEGRRNKVPLEKGFSQVSWLKLTKSSTDLTGGQGRRRDITLEEVQQHKTQDDAWMVLHGKVYNITPYLRYHPGGADILMKAAGKDGTTLFNKYHPWVNAHALLEKCLIGLLHKPEEEQPQSIKEKLTSFFK